MGYSFGADIALSVADRRVLGWFAVAGPPKMAVGLRDRIANDFIETLKMPDVVAKYRALSVEPGGQSPAETAAFVKDETRIWGDVIKKNNIVVD